MAKTNANNSVSKPTIQADKKVFIAVGLILVMVGLWVKILVGTKKAQAKETIQTTQQSATVSSEQDNEVTLSYIKLPVKPGRHDRLASDIFAPKKWLMPESKDSEKVDVQPAADNTESAAKSIIQKIASNLKIQAISLASEPAKSRVFIEDKMLSVGSVLPVTMDGNKCQLTVTSILENKVIFKWKGFSVAIKMAETGR